jgi:hypothetical protein
VSSNRVAEQGRRCFKNADGRPAGTLLAAGLKGRGRAERCDVAVRPPRFVRRGSFAAVRPPRTRRKAGDITISAKPLFDAVRAQARNADLVANSTNESARARIASRRIGNAAVFWPGGEITLKSSSGRPKAGPVAPSGYATSGYPRNATIWPPSTTMVAPTIKRPASDTSSSIAPSRSPSWPNRPTGISRLSFSPASLVR